MPVAVAVALLKVTALPRCVALQHREPGGGTSLRGVVALPCSFGLEGAGALHLVAAEALPAREVAGK